MPEDGHILVCFPKKTDFVCKEIIKYKSTCVRIGKSLSSSEKLEDEQIGSINQFKWVDEHEGQHPIGEGRWLNVEDRLKSQWPLSR